MDANEAIQRASDGKAVLFTGAGFSAGATNVRGGNLRRAVQLAQYFASMAGLPSGSSLA